MPSPTLLLAVLTPLAAILGAYLGYVATRKRDTPTIAIDQQRADIESAKAVSELWAEYAARMRQDSEASLVRIGELQRALENCLADRHRGG